MKKMIIYILVGLCCAFAGVAFTLLITSHTYEEAKYELEAKLETANFSKLQLKEQVTTLTEEKTAISNLYNELHEDHNKLQANYELLEDVIIKMRTAPEADKLLKERLPYGMTNTLRFMDYQKITDTTSIQYRLQEDCDTDVDSGIRVYYINGTDYYCAALGSAYGRDIGDTWKVTLDCGTEFNIILSDFKDDGTTDYFGQPDKNYDGEPCTSVIEFVVDNDYIPSSVKSAGTYTVLGGFGGLYGKGGNIIEMKYLGRVWE